MTASGRGAHSWRRVVAVPVLALSVLVSSVAWAPPTGACAGFGDVYCGAFYTHGVQWMVDNDITLGVTPECFEPYTPIDRGQAAVFMWRMEGRPAPSAPDPFTDVPAWMSDAVAWMVEQEVTLGTSATTYSPGQVLTRAELVTFLWRLAGSPAPASTMHPFTDIVDGAFYDTAVLWAVEQAVTFGTSDTTFSPGDTVTRGQVATFLRRYKDPGLVPAGTVDGASPLCRGRDDFNGTLQARWSTPIYNIEFVDSQSLTLHPGFLALQLSGPGRETLFRDPVAEDYVIETKMRFDPSATSPGRAGLRVFFEYRDETEWTSRSVHLYRAECSLEGCVDDAVFFVAGGGLIDGSYDPLPPGTGDLYLRIRHQAGVYTGSYSVDGTTWVTVASITQTLDDPVVGVFAGSLGPPQPPVALFDWFSERPL